MLSSKTLRGASAAALGLPPISISSAFDGGNILHVNPTDTYEDTSADAAVHLHIRPDPYTELEQKQHLQYFSFKSRAHEPKKVHYKILNAGECSYADAWPNSTVFYSSDGQQTWRRVVDTQYTDGVLHWKFEHGDDSKCVYFSYFPPYSYERHCQLVAKCDASERCEVMSLGQTLDGRDIDCIKAGNGNNIAWIIHRQHPGETMAEFFAEGLLHRLLGLDTDGSIDGLTKKALGIYTFYIVPNMCLDGSVRGHLRTNAAGANLNREWTSTGDYEAPTKERSPEVYYVLKAMDRVGVDAFADIHGDEALPFNFLAGSEGCPNWNTRLKNLHGAFLASYSRANSDMQKEVSYEPDSPLGANLAICSNQIAARFDCLAFTLEMPFKDCLSNPDPERGFSPARAAALGKSILDPLVYVQPFLRGIDEPQFLEEDKYCRPTDKY